MSEPEKVSRRKFMYYGIGAAVVIVGGAIAAYYLMQPPTPTNPKPEEDPLFFNIWPYRPDLVEANMTEFKTQFSPEAVTVGVIAGDYAAQIEAKLLAGSKDLDFCYSGSATANRWYDAGWTRGIEEMEPRTVGDVEVLYSWKDIKADLPAAAWNTLLSGSDGKPCFLPYFQSCFGNILTNEKLLEKGGYADTKAKTSNYPKNYPELYQQCEDLQKKGVAKSPLLKRWGSEVWEMGFVAQIEAQARGDPVFDKNMDPVFDINTPYAEMLKDWQYLYEKEICPRGVLNITEGDNITWFETGEYAYTEQHTYDLFTFQDPASSKVAPYCSIVPPLTKNSPIGYLLVNGAIISNPTTARSDWKLARVHRLAEFYTYKDKNGKFYRPKNFMTSTGVGSPYPQVLDDSDVVNFVKTKVYRDQDVTSLKQLVEACWMPEYLKTSWESEWSTLQQPLLQQCVQGSITVEACINQMRTDAQTLKKKYAK